MSIPLIFIILKYLKDNTVLFFIFIFLLGIVNYSFSQEETINIFELKNEDGSIDFFATNTHKYSFTAKVDFDVLTNFKSSITLPFKGLIEAKTDKKYLFTITPTTTSNNKYSYSCSYSSSSQSLNDDKGELPEFDNCTEENNPSLCITLSELNSEELDTSLFKYEWVLGDGNTIIGSKIKHCYAAYGEYIIKLNVFDKFTNDNLYNVATETVLIKKENGLFFDIPVSANINQKVPIRNVVVDIDGFDNSTFYWDFGDGSKAMGNQENHIFVHEGDYNIKLGVISISGLEKLCIFKNIKILK